MMGVTYTTTPLKDSTTAGKKRCDCVSNYVNVADDSCVEIISCKAFMVELTALDGKPF